jgi:cephalosporin hydroxylase
MPGMTVPADLHPADYLTIAHTAINDHGALQRPGELADALRILHARHADPIVEIGCAKGGTLWAWSHLPYDPYVIGVNLDPVPAATGADVIVGDSHNPVLRDFLHRNLMQGAGALIIDGDHSYDGLDADYHNYRPIVRPGGLILIHDIGPDGEPDVRRWWRERYADWATSPTYGVIEIYEEPQESALGWGVVILP